MRKLKDNDYTLVEGGGWFDVGGLTLRIHTTDTGAVMVEVFDHVEGGDYDSEMVASMTVNKRS
jgi:hypothetical protein